MLAILKKELRLFFGSLGGHIIICGFLLLNGLWLWVFNGNNNILTSGYADLTFFFNATSWLFLLVIPALTMSSFSKEIEFGTIEILKTRPLNHWQVIGGKFLAVLLIVTIMLCPTLVYVYSIHQLATPIGNIDYGPILGSYVGLLFLSTAFISLGIWISSFTKNTLVSLLSSTSLAVFLFFGIDELTRIYPNIGIDTYGLSSHFSSISRGVIDTRDISYFVFVSVLFLAFAKYRISTTKNTKNLLYTIIALLVLLSASKKFHKRFDFTSDKKYTLTKTSINILDNLEESAVIKVYLEGDFPSEFRRLQSETKQILEELKAKNKNLKILFVDPKNQLQDLISKGLTPSRLTIQENGIVSESVILPWATVTYKNKIETVSLLKNSLPTETQEQQLEKSVQNLEYAFANALKQVSSKKEKSIAVLSGNGQLEDIYLYSLLETVGKNYHLAKFTLDSLKTSPIRTIEHLNSYDLAIIAKPSIAFTEEEKYALDQYILNGGKSLWMIDNVLAEMDSLFHNGKTLAYPKNLNLDDFFFRYGARLNQNLVKDLYASKIALATGNTGNKTNFENFLWFYAPLVQPNVKHPITTNIDPVSLSFVSTIDTLKNNIKKTVLLESSVLSKEIQIPAIIELNSVMENPNPNTYKNGNKILGVLLEGAFTSAYKDRLKPITMDNAKESGISNKMIIIADGDIGKNQIHNGNPLELGINKWTHEFYGNKDFLLNAIDYLLDDSGLIQIRSKSIHLNYLNKEKISEDKTFWQLLNLCFPILVIIVFALINYIIRKRRYGKPLI